jgi:hypothetical protein
MFALVFSRRRDAFCGGYGPNEGRLVLIIATMGVNDSSYRVGIKTEQSMTFKYPDSSGKTEG